MMDWLLGRGRVPCLVLVALVTAVLGVHAARTGIDHDNAALNAEDAGQLRVYRDFKAAFGNDEDLLVAVTPPALLSAEGIALLDDVTRTIAGWDGVRRVFGLTTVEALVPGDAGAEPRPLVTPPWDAPGLPERLRAALDANPDLTGWMVSADRRTAGLVIQLDERPHDPAYHARLIADLRALGARHVPGGTTLHLTGVPVQKHDVAAYVARDQRVLLPLAALVLGATLLAFFRTITGVVVPLGLAAVAVVWTIGIYEWTGHLLNAITSLLPPVLLVVSVAGSVHVYDAWHRGHEGSTDPRERVARAVRAVWVPGLLCAVTTAQGFLSLVLNDVPAVRQFGVFAALGSAVAFVVGMSAVPAALTFVVPPPPAARDEHRVTLRLLEACAHLATTRPGPVLVLFGAVTLLAATGIPRIRSNTDLVGFLRPDAPLRIDTTFIDRHLGGSLPLDFVLTRTDGRPVASLDAIQRLDALEDAVRTRPHVSTVTSVLALLRQVHRAETDAVTLALPTDGGTLRDEIDLLDASEHPLVRRFAAPDFATLRLAVRLRAVGSAESAPLVAAVVADAARILGPEYDLVPTGALYHVVHDSTRLVREQVASFASAIVLVVLAIGLLFRSVVLTLVALIPNVMPIVWTGGLMGWTGIELSTGTAMIASAVLGLVVDDTIHYLAHYRRSDAPDAVTAIRETTRVVGAPVTVASVSLILGFWVGAFGSFRPTVYFSLLTGLTMITGVVCDLLVLPATLVMVDRLRRRHVR